ncbi:MAG: LysM domain-containing protein [Candidatus Roizmanbacteria bacterium]|nr:LysM domain-containing protein [Candidatus Roizmanbacteria bacterium]
MVAKMKKKVRAAKKETPVDLIQKKPNAFAVGSIALLLGVVAGVLLIQQRMPPQTKDQKRRESTPSVMQNNNKKQGYTEYVMQENESLSDVAQRFYNDPNRYMKIAEENNILNPDIVEPGTKIKLYNLPQ